MASANLACQQRSIINEMHERRIVMRLKQFFQLLIVALFVFSYQEITIHSKQHLIETVTECHLCDAVGHLDLHHQQESSPLVINEHFAIRVHEVEEKQVVQAAYDLTQKPEIRMVDFDGLYTTKFDPPSLGYFSTAPPYLFS